MRQKEQDRDGAGGRLMQKHLCQQNKNPAMTILTVSAALCTQLHLKYVASVVQSSSTLPKHQGIQSFIAHMIYRLMFLEFNENLIQQWFNVKNMRK